MLRIPCPRCNKTSYTPDVESFHVCPHCGFTFSGKYGPNRRREERIKQEIPFVFSYQGKNLEASTVDVSERGLGIKIFSDLPIATGDILNLTIGDLSVVAKVVWVKKLPDKILTGLSKVN